MKTEISFQALNALNQIYEAYQMDLQEFLALYPDVSRKQLARIAGCTVDVVDRWFAQGKRHRKPTRYQEFRMAIAHWYLKGQNN